MKFIPNPDHLTPEHKRAEDFKKKRYGECYGCRNHDDCVEMCKITRMFLSYPISECPLRNFSF